MENENKVMPSAEETEVVETPGEPENVIEEEVAPVEEKPVENRCPNCQALLEEGQVFCPDCGTPLKKVCPNCNTELSDEQAFCPSCGHKNEPYLSAVVSENIAQFNAGLEKKKSSKKIVGAIIGGIVAIIVAIGAIIGYTYNEEQKVLTYISKVETYHETMETADQMLTYLDSIWEIVEDSSWNIRSSIREYARNLNSSYISTEKTRYVEITNSHAELTSFKSGNADVIVIRSKVEEVHTTYLSIYESVVDDESTAYNLSSLSSRISELATLIENAKEKYVK